MRSANHGGIRVAWRCLTLAGDEIGAVPADTFAMTSRVNRPLWLSVPAASGSACFAVSQPARWRLLGIHVGQGEAVSNRLAAEHWMRPHAGLTIAVTAGERVLSTTMSANQRAGSVATISHHRLEPGEPSPVQPRAEVRVCGRSNRAVCPAPEPVMTSHELDLALSAGRQAVERAKLDGVRWLGLYGTGAGLAVANAEWTRLARPGCVPESVQKGSFDHAPTWLADRCQHEAYCVECIRDAVCARTPTRRCRCDAILIGYVPAAVDPYQALRRAGGREQAALAGAALAAAQLGLPLMLFGAGAHVAAGLAVQLNDSVSPWLQSAPGCAGRWPDTWPPMNPCARGAETNSSQDSTNCRR